MPRRQFYWRRVWERMLLFAVGLDRDIVPQNGTQAVEFAFFVGHGDQLPVAVSLRGFVHEERSVPFIRLCRWGGDEVAGSVADMSSEYPRRIRG